MRTDLDHAFKAAHNDIAAVIRDLQRGGAAGQVTAQQAARAREVLQSLEQRTESDEATARPAPEERPAALDWRNAKAGDSVVLPGGGKGVLESLPDRHGKVTVRAASARLVLPAEKLRLPGSSSEASSNGAPPSRPRPAERSGISTGRDTGSEIAGGGTLHCDLRGMRVADALDRVEEMLDDGAASGSDGVEFIHGFGTGALRKAVREYLAASSYVSSYQPGDRSGGGGGDGVTIAILRSPGEAT